MLPGVSNALIPADALDTPLTYEAMAAAGSGLGSVGFIVLDDASDPVAVVAGASRFLAVESCGQCTPCKQDGLTLASLLDGACHGRSRTTDVVAAIAEAASTGGRRSALQPRRAAPGCSCGRSSTRSPTAVQAHVDGTAEAAEPGVVAELVDIRDGEAVVDIRHRDKQPDWTFDEQDSGVAPVDRLAPQAE